jgi:hypothetical protein
MHLLLRPTIGTDEQNFATYLPVLPSSLTRGARPGTPEPREVMSYPVPRNRERSLHTCAQDVQITRMATI